MAQLLSSLPIGAKVKFGKHSVEGEAAQDIVWLIVAKNHQSSPSYPTNSITLLTENVIDIRCFDDKEKVTWGSRNLYGYSRYSLSNIDQWLNKDGAAGAWYEQTHTYDNPPSSTTLFSPYENRPAFLHFFSEDEKNAILPTTFISALSDYESIDEETITRSIFLPSTGDLRGEGVEGKKWAYFSNHSTDCGMTKQCSTYSKSASRTAVGDYWTRTCDANDAFTLKIIRGSYSGYYNANATFENGVRPATNISSTMKVSDTTDVDGCYTFVWNSAPIKPTTLTTPTIYGGKNNSIAWSIATDPDGDAVTYQLECSINGGTYAQIYNGTALSYAHLVPFGTSTVSYRVKATDPLGESSAYTTSATLNVINNNAPVISGSDSNLGVKSSGFTGTYTITDANNNTVTVTEAIDGVRIRSLVATLGQAITYGVTENTWLALPNGSHTLTISATDGIDTTVRTLVFTKLVDSFKIQNSIPWASNTKPSRIMVVVTRNIPSDATFKVEVCNNGYDTSPTWENCTDAVMSGLVHVFSNTTKTSTNWGVLVRVTVNRNGATGACYVSAIGGNFE